MSIRKLNKDGVWEFVTTLDELLFATPSQAGTSWSAQSGALLDLSDQFIVQFKPSFSRAEQIALLKIAGAQWRGNVGQDKEALVLAQAANAQALDATIAALSKNPNVEFAERDWTVAIQVTSNDPIYLGNGGTLWGMYGDQTTPANAYGSQAGEAWAAGHIGSAKTVVGIIDTGMDYTHPDLYLNVWINQKEISASLRSTLVDTDADGVITFRDLNNVLNAGNVADKNGNGRIDAGDLLADTRWENGIDEDGNGYKDDLVGWDFVNNDNDPFDDNNHGTHVAGTIGGVGGNSVGVAGVNWNVQMMPLKFLGSNGSGSTSAALAALDYYTKASQAAGTGQDFVATNNSWGGGGFSQAMQDAIVRTGAAGNLFVAAAGNSSSNNDVTASYPSNYNTASALGFDAVVAVAALTSTGSLASFSSYGASTVDLAAPGSGIYSTIPGGTYASFSGTSMATPHVTGALALYASEHANSSAAQLRSALLGSVQSTPSVASLTSTGGRLDVGSLLAGSSLPPPPPPASDLTLYGTTANDILVGGAGNDSLCGVPASGSNLGKGTVDRLTGGAGNDLFILGDSRGRFYDDGNSKNAGNGDYALVTDFSNGDRVQLKSGTYFLKATTVSGNAGMGIYHDSNGNGVYASNDELIGLVMGSKTLAGADIVFV